MAENLRQVIRQSLVSAYSLCVVQWLEESNTRGFKFRLRNIDITLSLDQLSGSWGEDTKILGFFSPPLFFFNPRDQHFHLAVLALQSLLAFWCSAAPQLATTGCFRFCSNPISPRDCMGFSKYCPVTWRWVCRVGSLLLSGLLVGDNTWHDKLPPAFPMVCGGTQLSLSPDLDCGITVSYMNSSSGESPCSTF